MMTINERVIPEGEFILLLFSLNRYPLSQKCWKYVPEHNANK